MSHKGLAARVVRLGAVRGYELRYNHSSVARWLRGEQPRYPAPELIADVLSVGLGRRIDVTDIGMATEGSLPMEAALHLPQRLDDSVKILRSLARDDLAQRHAFRNAGFDITAYCSAALRWLVAPRPRLATPQGSRVIGKADVEDIREATQAFRVLDNRMGGGRIRPTVIDYLHANVVPLLHQTRCTDAVRRMLFSAAAELAQLAGWQAYDLEWHGVAQRYLVQALSMARFADDEALGGEILAAMSHQAIWASRPMQAIDMAQAAQVAGRRSGQTILVTEALVMEAHAHALRGDARECSRALKGASEAFDRGGAERPPWLAYFDDAYFAARIAHCFRALGQGVQTEKYALRSLQMDGRFLRGKAFNIVLLAAGYALQKEIEEACVRGREAVDRVADLASVRAVTYIQNLLADLIAYDDVEDVNILKAYAESRLPSLQ